MAGFSGPSYVPLCNGGTNLAPDPQIAVGPTSPRGYEYIVVTVNGLLAIYETDGTFHSTQYLDGPTGIFSMAAACVYDPRCFFDHHVQRFVLTAIDADTGGGADGNFYLAVSQSSDPTSGWYAYTFPNLIGALDFTTAGYDSTNYYVTAGQRLSVWVKQPLLSGSPGSVQVVDMPGAFHPQPMLSWDGQQDWEYFVGRPQCGSPPAGCQLQFFAWDVVNSRLKNTTISFPSPNPDRSVSTCDPGVTLAADDGRIMSAVYRNNSSTGLGFRMYAPHTVLQLNHDVPEWLQIDPYGWPANPVARPRVEVKGMLLAGGHSFMPALAMNSAGSMGLVVATCSTQAPEGIAVRGRDPYGNWSSQANVKTGACASQGRWGDYFGIAVDPVNDMFWVIGEYWRPAPDDDWATWIQGFVVHY